MQAAYESIKNLSKLNKSLLLLAKIENGQFNEQAQIDFLPLIQEKINEFADWWSKRQIRTTIQLQQSMVQCNAQLATILFNNLFSNATQHNIPGGEIHIHLSNTAFTITNTGIASPLNTQKIFTRFYKQDSSANHGLGLSIVKQVCDSSAFTCSYSFSAPQTHSFTVLFSV